MADILFPRLANLLNDLGVPHAYGLNASERALLGDAATLVDHALVVYVQSLAEGAAVDGGVTLALSAADRGDLGLVVTPFGGVSYSAESGDWTIVSSVTAQIAAFAYGKHGATIVASAGTAELDVALTATLAAPDAGPAFVFGSSDGSRFEAWRREARAHGHADRSRAIVRARRGGVEVGDRRVGRRWGRFRVEPDSQGRTAHGFRFGDSLVEYERARISWCGRAGCDHSAQRLARRNVRDTDGASRIRGERRGSALEMSASVGLALGPLQVVVDRLGVLAIFDFSSGSGSAGVGDFSWRSSRRRARGCRSMRRA